MTLAEFDKYMKEILDQSVPGDSAMNGVQVGNLKKEIKTVAFAVDACMETFQRAAEGGADLLMVHHGLYWGKPRAIINSFYDRIKFLMDNDLALYGSHLPLDMNPEVGNNIGMAKILGLKETEPFGDYKGSLIGFKGTLETPATIEEIKNRIFGENPSVHLIPAGPEEITSVGIVSGGAPFLAMDAIRQDLDLFITGDRSHEIYHTCLEEGINIIFGGHYATETFGVEQLSRKVAEETSLKTFFIDVPTGV